MIVVEIGPCYRDGLVGIVGEDSEGASSIEGHSTNRGNIDIVLIQYPVDRGADASPDVICGLLLKVIVSLFYQE